MTIPAMINPTISPMSGFEWPSLPGAVPIAVSEVELEDADEVWEFSIAELCAVPVVTVDDTAVEDCVGTEVAVVLAVEPRCTAFEGDEL